MNALRHCLLPITLLLVVACGSGADRRGTSPPLPPLVRTAETRADIALMLSDVLATELCDQVRGRFLPIAHTKDGAPTRGDEPVGGRWWIRDCRAQIFGSQVAIYLAGPGWAWAEGSEYFWGTSEYVSFIAGGTSVGAPDASFDPMRRIAWVQFRPSAVPYASANVTNRLEAHGDFVGKTLSVMSIGIFGDTIDDKANAKAREVIAAAFNRQIAAGFVITMDLGRRQRDAFTFGQSAPPLRPFSDGVRWLVNEQQVLHAKPGGVHVNGPFAPTQSAGVDFAVISGTLKYRAECERDVVAWFEPLMRGSAPVLPTAQHAQVGVISAGAQTRRSLAASCPWYLITEPASDEVIANIRVRADATGYPLPGP